MVSYTNSSMLYSIDSVTVATAYDCESPCKKCKSEFFLSECTSCYTNATERILHESKCIASCPAGFYEEQFTCKRCHGDCKTCNNANTCIESAFLPFQSAVISRKTFASNVVGELSTYIITVKVGKNIEKNPIIKVKVPKSLKLTNTTTVTVDGLGKAVTVKSPSEVSEFNCTSALILAAKATFTVTIANI